MFVRIEPAHVNGCDIGLSRTAARSEFKQNAGQNNHFLITILVGLDAVYAGSASLNEEFSTSWTPKSHSRSALRSRDYALVTSMAWIADLVDVYRKRIVGLGFHFAESERRAIENQEGRAAKLEQTARLLSIPKSDHTLLMTLFAIRWRNTIVHSSATKRLSAVLRAGLLESATAIGEEYRGLDVQRSIETFESGGHPTFKEVASFISASQRVVEQLDLALLHKMDVSAYAETVLQAYFSNLFTRNPHVYSQFWPGNPQKSRDRLTNALCQNGFTRGLPIAKLDDEFLNYLSHLSAREARDRYSHDESGNVTRQ